MALDLVKAVKSKKANTWNFFLDTAQWRKFSQKYVLTWRSLPFDVNSQQNVPKRRGVYAFTVKFGPSNLPPHGYLMYVGIAGLGRGSHLRSRFSQYLREKKRPRILLMKENWVGALNFNFAEVSDGRISLRKLERLLLNATQPPVNYLDFSAEVMAVRKASFG